MLTLWILILCGSSPDEPCVSVKNMAFKSREQCAVARVSAQNQADKNALRDHTAYQVRCLGVQEDVD